MTPQSQQFDPEAFAAVLASKCAPGAIESLFKESQYEKYQEDPVGFCKDILGATITDDV